MNLLARSLLALALLVTCTQGFLLLRFGTVGHNQAPAVLAKPADDCCGASSSVSNQRPVASTILAKLGLSPLFRREKALVAVVVENHVDARPHQVGLRDALLVFEWPVEGLISRFIAVYEHSALPDRLGPVRSLRPYFVDSIAPWSHVFIHAGGSPEAMERFDEHSDLTTINGLTSAYHDAFERDREIAAPHNFFITRTAVEQLTSTVDVPPVAWPLYKTGAAPAGEAASALEVEFYSPLHNVRYTYDEQQQHYIRSNGSVMRQVEPRNVLILEIPIEQIGAFGRLDIPVQGSGEAVLLRSGRVYEGTWEKADTFTPFTFSDADGKPLVFARGQTWVTVVPTLDRVSWDS